MRSVQLVLLSVTLALLPVTAALPQATLQQQRVTPKDICEGLPNPDAASCAQDALWDHNWLAFLKWGQKAVAGGDHVVAIWLGEEYERGVKDKDGEKGINKDLVRAYMWYDIAAQLHARKIQQMPPAENSTYAENNTQEINYRDAVARNLTAAQISEALRLEKAWFSAHR